MIEIEIRPEVKEHFEDANVEAALEKLRNKINNFERKNIKSTIAIMYITDSTTFAEFIKHPWLRAVLVTKEPDGQHKTRRFFWGSRNKTYGWRNS